MELPSLQLPPIVQILCVLAFAVLVGFASFRLGGRWIGEGISQGSASRRAVGCAVWLFGVLLLLAICGLSFYFSVLPLLAR
jgi:hypothetical protein